MKTEMSEYNTQKPKLVLKEYGRNIQKLVEYMTSVEDDEKRNSYAAVLVDLMRQINPNIKESSEYNQKLWDDLFIMSDFKADINSPYPKPEEGILTKKPQRVGYNVNRIRYKHYGRNIELIIEKAISTEDPEEREAFVIYLGKLMKTFYASWNKEVVSDQVIIDHIKELSKNKLDIDPQKVKDENLFEILYKEKNTKPKKENTGKRGNNGKKRRRN
ncbi:DUF4290 domain-containing protein [Fulvivirgaceae bacterium BMA12]|uniref:DUF4290 domain-containing protein n=1 Tax=Agaribacillus aureus TaxID=3051825 RepID=A0ABT8L1J6_9BACT|nr:DUF4290 domain-containing protein [Fulvivirgaceae bacterium BMA12]